LIGGYERYAFEVTERLALKKELAVDVFAHEWERGRSDIQYHKIPAFGFPGALKEVRLSSFLGKAMPSGVYDLVHSHEWVLGMDILSMHGIPHKRWMRQARKKRFTFSALSRGWLERKCLRGPKVPMLLPVSSLVREELLKEYPVPGSKVRIVHPGVSPERFRFSHREDIRKELRRFHGVTEDQLVMLFVGMNFEIKRLDLVLKATATLVKREKPTADVKVWVVGKGDVNRYEKMCGELGIRDRATFVSETREIEKYYAASDLFVMPSEFDTFGMVVLEAMAGGLPVIITKRVGARDLVENNVSGLILSEDPSPSELADGIFALRDPDRRLGMGEKAQQVAFQNTWEKTASRVWDCYQEIMQ
jgi:UDP-glucose:(heptosyl)LPS alpha-1,3-glucosyltransferase